jgi:hypothetical protein
VVAKKIDPAKKAIDSIGKPKKHPALEAEKKLAKMSPEEFVKRREEMRKVYKSGSIGGK